MKIVFDTNVIVDVLTDRDPFAEVSTKALAAVERNDIVGAMTANTITDVYYILRRREPSRTRRKAILKELIAAVEVLDTTKSLCCSALDSSIADFEDAVVVESAKQWSADCIVTRNTEDFVDSPIKVMTPAEFIEMLSR